MAGGYAISAGIPSSGSPPPTRSTSETANATIDPVRLAFGSKIAHSNCGNRRTNTRSLVKNHSACTLWTFSASTVAMAPNSRIEDRITRDIRSTDNDGHSRRLKQFQLSMEPADRIDELKLDVTGPMSAARPRRPIAGGTAVANSNGIASTGAALSRARFSRDHG